VGYAQGMNDLGRIDYEDTFSVDCPAGTSASDVLLGFFSSAPKIVKVLMAIRNRLVSLIGLKTERPIPHLDASMLRTGSRVGFFEIGSITPQSAIMGADDRHLNFRVHLEIQGPVLRCKTEVHFNNALGRIYFFFVKPFHRSIVPAMLKASVKRSR
jgi:Protein of unknown function (DUF2867)